MSNPFSDRFDQADQLGEILLKQAFRRSKSSLGEESPHYALGYIVSVLKRVAAESPSALKQLRDSVDFEASK